MAHGKGKARRGGLAARFVLVVAGCGLAAGAQAVPGANGGQPATASAVVTGHVTCADTQHAARFAQVELIPASSESGLEGFRGRGGRGIARTDLEGNYSMSNVSPGDYFVVAQMTGYVNERGAVEAALAAGTDPATTLGGVPEVHVGSGGTTADLLLQRGGVIAGTVMWDDGSPAAGVQVSTQIAPSTSVSGTSAGTVAPAGNGFGGFNGGQTDDRGRFRISGLAAGSYLVRASVQAPMPQTGGGGGRYRTLNLAVYAPDKPRRTDATPIKLVLGEERDDVAITMGLSLLHSLSGTVSSPGAAVHSGMVTLTDQTDSSLNRAGSINADGSFVVPYVPAGSYTLRVSASSQLQGSFGRGGYGQGEGGGTGFQPLQESVTVTDSDLTGMNLTVTPAVSASQ